jgi:hypothetical protein
MGIVKLQDAPITIGTPIEIEKACDVIRERLATLPWVDFPYFIAQRFYRLQGSKQFYYPETYARDLQTPDGKWGYHRLTPDNDYKGMFFFYLGENGNYNGDDYITYNVALIFSVNLDLIDEAKLELGLFTQELVRDARALILDSEYYGDFTLSILRESRDLRTVYREFTLDPVEQYNRAPLQCFRFDLTITYLPECL